MRKQGELYKILKDILIFKETISNYNDIDIFNNRYQSQSGSQKMQHNIFFNLYPKNNFYYMQYLYLSFIYK